MKQIIRIRPECTARTIRIVRICVRLGLDLPTIEKITWPLLREGFESVRG